MLPSPPEGGRGVGGEGGTRAVAIAPSPQPLSPSGGEGLSERTFQENEHMEKISVAQARQVEAVGRQVRLQGWVRTRRDSKGGFSFLELNDGSCQGNVQVVADGSLPNYQSEILHLTAG